MPIALLERLPLPSLRSYVSVSLLLTSCAVYYAHHLAQHVAPLVDVPAPPPFLNSAAKSPAYAPDDVSVDATVHQTWAKTSDGYFYDMVAVLIGEGWCVWVGRQSSPYSQKSRSRPYCHVFMTLLGLLILCQSSLDGRA